jgi:hypothetical protein
LLSECFTSRKVPTLWMVSLAISFCTKCQSSRHTDGANARAYLIVSSSCLTQHVRAWPVLAGELGDDGFPVR